MHRESKKSRPDRLPLQTVHQDERISHPSANDNRFSTPPLLAEAAVGISITFLVFINSIAPNIHRTFSRMLDQSIPTSNLIMDDLNSKTVIASGITTETGGRDVEMVDIAALSAPEALAIYFSGEDMASRDGTLVKSPADEQRRDARKFAMDEALHAVQETSQRRSCITPNERFMSRNNAVTFSNSGRATVARVAK